MLCKQTVGVRGNVHIMGCILTVLIHGLLKILLSLGLTMSIMLKHNVVVQQSWVKEEWVLDKTVLNEYWKTHPKEPQVGPPTKKTKQS